MIKNDSAIKKTYPFGFFYVARKLMNERRSYTETESVVKSYLEIVANLLHDGNQAVHKVAQIPSFKNTVKHRFDMVADSLKQQLMAK